MHRVRSKICDMRNSMHSNWILLDNSGKKVVASLRVVLDFFLKKCSGATKQKLDATMGHSFPHLRYGPICPGLVLFISNTVVRNLLNPKTALRV